MKLALVQMGVRLGEPAFNRSMAAERIQQAAEGGADTVVLPETWNLGFFPGEDLERLAEEEGGESRALLSRLAARFGINLVGGSLITKRMGKVYNTAYVMDRSGAQIAAYDKIHSFSPSGEHRHFHPGDQLCTFRLDGVVAGLVICYDLRFGELARLLALQGAQILFVPAQWPGVRLEHWAILNRARAVENQVFVAGVNGCGAAGALRYGGGSLLVDPLGEVLAEGGEEDAVLFGEADFSRTRAIRDAIPVFRDRRPALYRRFISEMGSEGYSQST